MSFSYSFSSFIHNSTISPLIHLTLTSISSLPIDCLFHSFSHTWIISDKFSYLRLRVDSDDSPVEANKLGEQIENLAIYLEFENLLRTTFATFWNVFEIKFISITVSKRKRIVRSTVS